jgi:sialidase-1
MKARVVRMVGLFCAFTVIALAAEKGKILSTVVVPARSGNHRNSEGTILKLHKGLLLAWTEFYTQNGSDWGPSRISSMTSYDDGMSWKDKRVIQPNIGKMNVMEADLVRLHDGKILFVFARKNSEADCVPMVRISNDDARTFSPPRMIPVHPYPAYYTINNDRVIQLRSGRILVPVAYTEDYRVKPRLVSRVYYSDDEGKTWKGSKTIIDVESSTVGADEPGVVELPNGSVMLWIRTNTGHPYQSYSRDGGETWSPVKPMNVDAPNSPQSIKLIPSSRDLIMVWNNSPNNRFPLSTAISKDDGRAWQHIKNLDDDADHTYAYTSITFVGKRVFFTYYSGPPAGKHAAHVTWSLKMKRVPISWLYE